VQARFGQVSSHTHRTFARGRCTRAPQIEVATEGKAKPKVVNIMAALKEGMQAKGRAKVRDAVRRRMGKPAATRFRKYRPFKQARELVHGLRLKSRSEWSAFCKSDEKPKDIPTAADVIYSKAGWSGWGDWLGTGSVAAHN
jgi:hypothetical protein